MTGEPEAPSPGAAELLALRTELLGRLDTLSQELRRQGRASLGAQAAAEACLEALQRSGDEPPLDREAVAAAAARAEAQRWLRALLPVMDALERVAAQAASAASEASAPPPRSLLARLLSLGAPEAPGADAQAARRTLQHGLALLQQLAQQSLEGLGVRVERATGVALDPQRHRVVEARPGQGEARVLEVVRPGYLLGDVCVREADVVASGADKERGR